MKNNVSSLAGPDSSLKTSLIKNSKILIAFGIAVLLFIVGEIVAPGFASLSHVLIVIKTTAFLGVLALAQGIIILAGGEGIDLSVGAIASAGAVIGSTVLKGEDINLIPALIVVLILGFILGLINGMGVSFFKIPPLIMTLAMSSVITGGLIIYTNGVAITTGASPLLVQLSGKATGIIPNMVILWLAIIILAVFVLQRTKSGIKLYGVGANELTAELNGVKVKTVRALAYAVSGSVSALGGLFLLGYIGNPFIDIGEPYVLPSVAAVVIGGVSLAGGKGKYLGVVAGSIVLTTLSGILITLKMGEAGRQVTYGLVLLILLAIYGRQVRKK